MRPRLAHGRHGHTHRDGKSIYCSPTYYSWYAMLLRCEHSDHPAYARYGAKGVTICPRWHAFVNFLADKGERPDGTSLDRYPDRNGDYWPENTRWATPAEQSRNRDVTKLTFEAVQEILGRLEHGEHEDSIAERFDLCRKSVNDIRNGKIWKDASPFQGRPAGIQIVSVVNAMKAFGDGDLVTWKASSTEKQGHVVEVVAANARPRLTVRTQISTRSRESYIVQIGQKFFWSDIRNLHLLESVFRGASAPHLTNELTNQERTERYAD